MTKLSSSLPKEIEENGLMSINSDLINKPDETVVVVAVLQCKQVTEDMFTRAKIATAQILQVEPLSGADGEQALMMLRAANERRVPRPEPLPGLVDFSFDAITKKFNTVDTATGEITDGGDDDDEA